MPKTKLGGLESEVVLADLGALAGGKLMVRLVQNEEQGRRLDVRQFVQGTVRKPYTGFTRRGIRLTREQAVELSGKIAEALKAGL